MVWLVPDDSAGGFRGITMAKGWFLSALVRFPGKRAEEMALGITCCRFGADNLQYRLRKHQNSQHQYRSEDSFALMSDFCF